MRRRRKRAKRWAALLLALPLAAGIVLFTAHLHRIFLEYAINECEDNALMEIGSLMEDEVYAHPERYASLVQLDYDIYEQSFAWMAAHPGQLPLSLNVSPVHFAHPRQFVQKVKELLARYPVEPSRVIFEITERCYIQNTEAVNQVIHELHQLHIRISMDDFGSGYSSLGSLKDINFDEVKIDRRFIADGLSERGEIVLQEIFHVLKRLKKSIVCEGVETTEVSDFLVEAGCDEIQGYLYYRPMPEQEFEALLG